MVGMKASKILTISYSVRERIAAGAPVTQFTVGDFKPKYFPVPDVLKEGARTALAEDQTNYPPADGLPELRRAVRDHYERSFGLNYPVESVVVGSGARPVLFASYQCLINEGEKVLAPAPGWNNEVHQPKRADDVESIKPFCICEHPNPKVGLSMTGFGRWLRFV